MKIHTPYLLYQVARFGALRFSEIESLCEGKCSKSVLYENIAELIQHRYVERFCHPDIYRAAYRTTQIGFQAALGNYSVAQPKIRELDLKHTLRVAQILINLARFDHVSGIATEQELARESLREFSHSKIPDGIIQVSREGASYEIAIEVEVTPKASSRYDEFLDKYAEVFRRSPYCSGVIVICDSSDIYARYVNLLAKRDEPFRDRVLLVQGPGLESLNPEVYGYPRKSPGKCAEKRRSHSGGTISYFPIESTKRDLKNGSLPPHRVGQSEILTKKEYLQPINQSIRHVVPIVLLLSACSHSQAVKDGSESRAKLGQEVVREAVVFEPGTKDGAVVPEISAPSLRAIVVEEKIEGNRLIERHREWILEGDVQLLGIPKDARKDAPLAAQAPRKAIVIKKARGGSHEN